MNYASLETEAGKDFLKAVSKLRTAEEIGEFFTDMFTPAEARTFVSRWRAASQLYDKIPYLDIQKETGLSSATVARVSQAMQYGSGGLNKILQRIKKSTK